MNEVAEAPASPPRRTRWYYDTETNDFPKDHLPPDDPAQCHAVQIAGVLKDADYNTIGSMSFLVKPDGWKITPGAQNAHGISLETCEKYGLPIKLVMMVFTNLRTLADEELAHNIAFDDKVIRYELARLGGSKLKTPDRRTCTMTIATPIVNLPPTRKMLAAGFNKPKSASLTECHEHFFGCKFDGAHDAMNDVLAMIRVHQHIIVTGGESHAATVAKKTIDLLPPEVVA